MLNEKSINPIRNPASHGDTSNGVNKILFITLSNIGDCILTLPCLDLLRHSFPDAKISVIAGPRPQALFKNNPFIDKLIIYDKKIHWQEKKVLTSKLKEEKFDLIVDFRNSMFGFFIGAKHKTSKLLKIPEFLHMKARHLYKVSAIIHGGSATAFGGKSENNKSLYISQDDKNYIEKVLEDNGITETDKIVLIGPGARSHIKRYTKTGFIKICEDLITDPSINPIESPASRGDTSNGVKIILVGDQADYDLASSIAKEIKVNPVKSPASRGDTSNGVNILNLCGKTSLLQLAYLITRARILISCDSAIMHMSSYINKPIVAIFGPTNEVKYGPWSDKSIVVRRNLKCAPCEVALCKYNHECMNTLDPEKVVKEAKKLLYL